MSSVTRRLALAFGAFVFIGILGTILPAEFPAARLAAQILYGVPLAAWAVARLGRRRTPVDIPIVVALLAFVVVALASRDVQGSLEMLAGALAWAVLFWLMADVRSPATRGALAMGAGGAITAWLAIFAVRWTGEKVTWMTNGGGMPNLVESTQTLFWLTTNVVPVLVLLGIGVIAYLPRDRGSDLIRWPFMALAVLTVPMSGGRAGWLGLVVAGLALLVMRHSGRISVRPTRTVAIGAVMAFTAAALLTATVAGGRALDVSGLTSRLPLWGEALAILASDPLTGGGPGTYSWLRLEHVPEYQTPLAAILAHNVLLQTLADGGLLLLAGLALVVGAVLVSAFRARRTFTGSDHQALAVLIGFGAMSLLDDHSALPAVAAMAVTLASWVVSGSEHEAVAAPAPERSGTQERRRRLAMLAVAGVVAVVSVPAAARVDLARVEAHTGRAEALRGEYNRASEAFARAISLYPDRPNYHLSAALTLALEGRRDEARDQYRRASELAPADARAWGGLAALATSDEDRLDLARRAAEAPNLDPRFAFSYGDALLAAAEADALVAFARAVAKGPTTIVPLMDTSLDPRRVADEVLARLDQLAAEARTDPDQIRWDLALAGLVDADDLGPAWRAVRALQDGDMTAAQAAVDEAIADDPLSSRTWLAARAVAEHRCDDDAAASARALAALTPGGVSRGRAEPIYRSNDLAYREPGLASYQPVPPPYDAAALDWPAAFLDPPRCAS